MYFNKKYFTVLIYGLMLTSASLAESLTDIYQSALQNDPVLRRARANFKAGLETKKDRPRCPITPDCCLWGVFRVREHRIRANRLPW